MTDAEIIATLEKIGEAQKGYFANETLDLIRRQQAEIKKLKTEYKAMKKSRNNCWKEFKRLLARCEFEKAEAIKKFAEKAVLELTANYSDKYCHWIDDTIDELVKEMAGDQ